MEVLADRADLSQTEALEASGIMAQARQGKPRTLGKLQFFVVESTIYPELRLRLRNARTEKLRRYPAPSRPSFRLRRCRWGHSIQQQAKT
jgi:hypothetical protein